MRRRVTLVPLRGGDIRARRLHVGPDGVRQVSKTLVRLNVETRFFHPGTDAPWLGLVANGTPSRLDYVAHLAACYGFAAPVEAALAYTPRLDAFVDLHPRFRAGLLAQDLLHLGMSPSTITGLRQSMVTPFSSVAEAFGWLYVHERTTLLHESVRSELVALAPELAAATSYLRANDGKVGVLWDDLGEAMDRIARTPVIEDRIVAAAIEASRRSIAWSRQSGPHRVAVGS